MMRFFRAGAAMGLLVAATASAPAAEPQLKIGMLDGMFRDVQPAMVQAMSKPFRNLFERQTGLGGDVEIVAGAELLASKLKEQSLQLGVFHGFEFAQARTKHPDLTPIVVTMPPGRILQAVVVVHKDHKGDCLTALGTEQLTLPRGLKAHGWAYIDKARTGMPADAAKPVHKPNVTVEEALNAVADGTLPAALVDAGGYAGYQELQPGLAKQLRVLCKSESFPPSVVAYRKGTLADDVVARVRSGLVGAHLTAQGKPLMMLWNLKGFEDVPADYAEQLANILKAYPAPVR